MESHLENCPQRHRDSNSPGKKRAPGEKQCRIRYRSIRKSRPSRYVMKEMRHKHIAIRGCYAIGIILSIITLCIAWLTSTNISNTLFHTFLALSVVTILCGPVLIRCLRALHEDNCYEDLSGNVFKYNFAPNWPLRLAFVSIAVSLLIVALGIHYNGDAIETYYDLSGKSSWNNASSRREENPKNTDIMDDAIDSIFNMFRH